MRNRVWILAVMAIALGLAPSALPQETKTSPDHAAIVNALNNAMDPGEGQKRLDFLVGTFDVKIRTWVDPSQPPFESSAVAVSTWVLGNRYVQTMLSGFVMGEPWNAIGYGGFDNVAKKYVALLHGLGQHGHGVVHGNDGPGG